MPIIDDQKRLNQVGRIRTGIKKPTANGNSRPAKLETFRFTSQSRRAIDAAAQHYGGTVASWENQWEVVTEANDIPVVVMPAIMEFDSWFENWSGAVCRSRCDGAWDNVRNTACDCDPENRTCKSTTRMQLLLPDLPVLGTWRLESHGYYARVELAGAVEIIRMAAHLGVLPARLRLEPRTVRRLIGDKVETRNFIVPVLDLELSVTELIGAGGSGSLAATGAGGVLPPGKREVGISPPPPRPDATPAVDPAPPAPVSSWKPVDQAALPAAPFVSVRDQLDEVQRAPKPRKNAAAPIKATGLAPRTAAGTICHLCGQDYGGEPLSANKSGEGNKWVHAACGKKMESPVGDPETPASQGEEAGGGDSTSSGPPTAEPVPAAKKVAKGNGAVSVMPISVSQHKMLMALTAEAFPVDPQKTTGSAADEMRRNTVVALAGQLGINIKSRADLTKTQASVVIDALVGLRDGTHRWVDGKFVDANTGEVVTEVPA